MPVLTKNTFRIESTSLFHESNYFQVDLVEKYLVRIWVIYRETTRALSYCFRKLYDNRKTLHLTRHPARQAPGRTDDSDGERCRHQPLFYFLGRRTGQKAIYRSHFFFSLGWAEEALKCHAHGKGRRRSCTTLVSFSPPCVGPIACFS